MPRQTGRFVDLCPNAGKCDYSPDQKIGGEIINLDINEIQANLGGANLGSSDFGQNMRYEALQRRIADGGQNFAAVSRIQDGGLSRMVDGGQNFAAVSRTEFVQPQQFATAWSQPQQLTTAWSGIPTGNIQLQDARMQEFAAIQGGLGELECSCNQAKGFNEVGIAALKFREAQRELAARQQANLALKGALESYQSQQLSSHGNFYTAGGQKTGTSVTT